MMTSQRTEEVAGAEDVEVMKLVKLRSLSSAAAAADDAVVMAWSRDAVGKLKRS